MVGRAVPGEPQLGGTPRPTWLLLILKLDDLLKRRHGRMNQNELN
jgi:hypothetical protein